uniref:Uncharacterized protein n=1 Tax=viral metagenome TaxID=1070528 RepID=A0A6C0DR55_9ZZZZ
MVKLCAPAMVYLGLSLLALFLMVFQNFGNYNTYCIGYYKCDEINTTFVFIIKIFYILFWTWILNIICKSGYSQLSWFLVLLPILLFFVLIAYFVMNKISLSL